MNVIGDVLLYLGDVMFGLKVEVLIVYNLNLVVVVFDLLKVVVGFVCDDLFMVVFEYFKIDMVDFVDIVLLVIMQFEYLDIYKLYGYIYVMVNLLVILLVGDVWLNMEIFCGIVCSMGFDEFVFYYSDEVVVCVVFCWDDLVFDSDWDMLKQVGWLKFKLLEVLFVNGGFCMLLGKCEFYSLWFEQMGMDFVFDYLLLFELVEVVFEFVVCYLLVMILLLVCYFLNSMFVNVDSLCLMEGELYFDMYLFDVSVCGIVEGDVVCIFNDCGLMQVFVCIIDWVCVGLVVGLLIWWKKLLLDGRNVNEVMSQVLIDLGNLVMFYDCFVEVECI